MLTNLLIPITFKISAFFDKSNSRIVNPAVSVFVDNIGIPESVTSLAHLKLLKNLVDFWNLSLSTSDSEKNNIRLST
jgi:hypothetical protein